MEDRATTAELSMHPFLNSSGVPENAATINQIRSQICSLSISTSQKASKMKKITNSGMGGAIYSINSIYLSGIASSHAGENPTIRKNEIQPDIRFSSSLESVAPIEQLKCSQAQNREDVQALELQLQKEKEMMRKLAKGSGASEEEASKK